MKILVTGTAGFIGCEVALRLLERGDTVIGIDDVNDYYDVSLKRARLQRLSAFAGYRHHEFSIAEAASLAAVFERERPQRVIHLAAQAGVRYSLENPAAYLASNLTGFGHMLECCRQHHVEHLTYASSSSVYGANAKQPFSEADGVDHPLNLYAATKKSNELMAHAYSHLFGLPTTGLRFFTVYGPWGRPDMAYFKFVRSILAGEPIELYNEGRHRRDFTYIDDITHGVILTSDQIAAPDPTWQAVQPNPASSESPFRVYNIGNNRPVELRHLITLIEDSLGRVAEKRLLPKQPGDALETYAAIDSLEQAVGYRPQTPLEVGIPRFVEWYRRFYRV